MASRPPAPEPSGQGHLRRECSVSRAIIGFNAGLRERKIVRSREKVAGEDPSPIRPSTAQTGHPGPSCCAEALAGYPGLAGRVVCSQCVLPPVSALAVAWVRVSQWVSADGTQASNRVCRLCCPLCSCRLLWTESTPVALPCPALPSPPLPFALQCSHTYFKL